MRIACLLLAAGAGRRFGGCKQLAPVGGKPLIRHSLDALVPLFGEDLFVVLGAYRGAIRPQVDGLARVIEHPAWRRGIGASIAASVSAIRSRADYAGLLVALADQYRLSSADFVHLIARFDGSRPVAAGYADGPGAPAIIPAALFERLQRLDGDCGAQSLLRDSQPETVRVSLPAALLDVDVADDIERVL